MFNNRGNTALLAILAISALLIFIIVTSLASFQNRVFKSLYPKKSSLAASIPKPYSGPGGATFSLSASAEYQQDQQIPVVISMRSDTFKANLFSAKINFDPSVLEIQSINSSVTFITNWVERAYDNSLGTVSVIGGVPKPGFATSGSDAAMAVLIFKAKAAGLFTVSFSPTSAIYKNTDNINILVGTTNATFIVTPLPTPSPSPSPSPTPTPTPTPSPTPTPPPLACVLTSASWVSSANPIDEGSIVSLSLTTGGDCVAKQVGFEIREDDGILGYDLVSTNPSPITLTASDSASTAWVAEYQPDGFNGLNDPPEYYFVATLSDGSSTVTSSAPELQVNKLPDTGFLPGDINRDSGVDLQDLSILFSYWFDTANYPDEADINSDGIINTFDFSEMLVILRSNGVIGPTP